MTPEVFSLIGELRRHLNERCEPGPPVYGEIWLRRHDNLLVVYWEVWEAPYEEDGTLRGEDGFSTLDGVVARRRGPTRWQSLAVVTPDDLPAEGKGIWQQPSQTQQSGMCCCNLPFGQSIVRSTHPWGAVDLLRNRADGMRPTYFGV